MAMLCKGKNPFLVDLDFGIQEEGVSSTNNISSCISETPPIDYDPSDTSLKLG